MASETTYLVNVKYAIDSRAGQAGVKGLNENVKDLARNSELAKGAFIALGMQAIELGKRGFDVLKKNLIDFNANVQSAKIGLSAMIQGNLGGSWDKATESAAGLYDEFQKFSTQTPVTTSEIMTFGKAVAVATFQAGGSIKDLTTITEKGVIAAKAFGYESAYSSLEISEMLSGNVSQRMMFAKQLLGMAHTNEEEFRKLNAEQRKTLVMKTLDSEAMHNAQAAFTDSWAGVTSTLEDKIQIALGKVGLPLFKAITAEVAKWNAWLDKNAVTVEKIGRDLGEGLAHGFGVVKDAIGFLVEHREALMTMGKIWLAVKIGGALGGGLLGAGGGVGRLAGWAGGMGAMSGPLQEGEQRNMGSGMRTQMGMGNIAGAIPLLAQSAAVGYAFGSIVSEATGLKEGLHNLAIGEVGRELERVKRASDSLSDALERAAAAQPDAGRAITNLAGSQERYKQLGNLAGDVSRAAAQGDPAIDKRNAMEAMGIGNDDISKAGGMKAFADQMNAKAAELGQRQADLQLTTLTVWESGLTSLTDYQQQTLDVAKAQQSILAYLNSHGLQIDPISLVKLMREASDDPTGTHKPMSEKPNVNVHIARIEVQSDNPDRMAFGLIESFRDAAKNPSSAFAALREG